jgi:hypothetical protein
VATAWTSATGQRSGTGVAPEFRAFSRTRATNECSSRGKVSAMLRCMMVLPVATLPLLAGCADFPFEFGDLPICDTLDTEPVSTSCPAAEGRTFGAKSRFRKSPRPSGTASSDLRSMRLSFVAGFVSSVDNSARHHCGMNPSHCSLINPTASTKNGVKSAAQVLPIRTCGSISDHSTRRYVPG